MELSCSGRPGDLLLVGVGISASSGISIQKVNAQVGQTVMLLVTLLPAQTSQALSQ